MSQPPVLTKQERLAALEKAAKSRRIRAEFKAAIKGGEKRWFDAFDNNEDAIAKMRVLDLVSSLPGFGSTRALAILEKAGISPTRRVQGIGRNQRDSLMKILGNR